MSMRRSSLRSVASSAGGLFDDDDETDQIVRQFDAYTKKTRLKMVQRRRRLSGAERAAAVVATQAAAGVDTTTTTATNQIADVTSGDHEVSLAIPEDSIQPEAPRIVQGDDGHWYEVYTEEVEVDVEEEGAPEATQSQSQSIRSADVPKPPAEETADRIRERAAQEREREAAEAAEVIRQFGGKNEYLKKAKMMFQ